MSAGRLRSLIRDIPDFPEAGIGFKDITPLIADAAALSEAVTELAALARPLRVDCVVAAEARGFLLGPAIALALGAGFVLARKPGKLPYETTTCSPPGERRGRCASSWRASGARSWP
jgi:adenine phosphoribosyltransferase